MRGCRRRPDRLAETKRKIGMDSGSAHALKSRSVIQLRSWHTLSARTHPVFVLLAAVENVEEHAENSVRVLAPAFAVRTARFLGSISAFKK